MNLPAAGIVPDEMREEQSNKNKGLRTSGFSTPFMVELTCSSCRDSRQLNPELALPHIRSCPRVEMGDGIAGRTGQEYNQRKKRKGTFWEDRYHATDNNLSHRGVGKRFFGNLKSPVFGTLLHRYQYVGLDRLQHNDPVSHAIPDFLSIRLNLNGGIL